MRAPKIERDDATGLWRIRWPDGRLSDITNISRAQDAIAGFVETEARRRREASR